MAGWQLTRRFFMVDNISGKQITSTSGKFGNFFIPPNLQIVQVQIYHLPGVGFAKSEMGNSILIGQYWTITTLMLYN